MPCFQSCLMPSVLTSLVSLGLISGPAGEWGGDLGSCYLTDSQSDGPVFSLSPLPLPASPHCPWKSPLDTLLCKLGQASAFPLLTSDPVLGWFSRSFTTPSVSSLQNLTSVASLPFLFILVGLCLYDNHLAVILVGCEKEQKQVPVNNPLTLPGDLLWDHNFCLSSSLSSYFWSTKVEVFFKKSKHN